jgi:hypothetical protein
MKKQLLSDLIALMFIILFVYAGWTKLLDHRIFHNQLATFDYINSFAGFLAWAVPLIHLGLALLFIWPSMRLWALGGTFVLLLTYSVYIILILYRGVNVPCACSGLFKFTSWIEQLVMNSVFLLGASIGIIFETNPKRKESFFKPQ